MQAADLPADEVAITWTVPFRLCVARTRAYAPIDDAEVTNIPRPPCESRRYRADRRRRAGWRSRGDCDRPCGPRSHSDRAERRAHGQGLRRFPERRSDLGNCCTRAWRCPPLAPIASLRLVHGTRSATVQLPFTAAGMTRRVLDEALLQQAERQAEPRCCGNTVAHRVSQPTDCCGRCTDRLARCPAGTVFLATGKHELRGAARAARGTGWSG